MEEQNQNVNEEILSEQVQPEIQVRTEIQEQFEVPGQQEPQQYQQIPPQYQQTSPQYQQVPPQYQQVPPQYQQIPPQYQQVHPQYQQIPPQMQQVPLQFQQLPGAKPPKAKKPKQRNGWKVWVAVICGIALILSVAGGTWLSAYLSEESKEDFRLTQASQNEDNMGYLQQVQNSEYASVSDIAEDVGQSVVTIIVTTDYTDYFMEYTGESLGSGIIIGEEDDKIYIATNFHVIESASDVSIIAGSDNSTTIQAYYQGADSDTDLAVIYVKKSEVPEEVRSEMKIATLGDSSAMRLGDLAIAIGSPVDKSFGNSVTAGTISGLERSVSFVDEATQTTQTMVLMQTDAAINPGNSGGALVNGRGEVIGINNAKISSTDVEGMGFAIPMNSAKPILETLINEGKVVRPYIGITGIAVSNYAEFAQQYQIVSGVIIISVMEDGPALYAGLQPYDVILSFDGKTIDTFEDLTAAIQEAGIGNSVEVEVLRGYQEGDPQIVTQTLTIAEKNTTGRK